MAKKTLKNVRKTFLDYFSKKNHQKMLAASAEESANMISGLIIDGLIQTK